MMILSTVLVKSVKFKKLETGKQENEKVLTNGEEC